MEFPLFFSPVPESVFPPAATPASLVKSISVYTEKVPDHKGAHIALIGVNETRGAGHNPGKLNGADEIRTKLYALKKGTGTYKIIDLGNLQPGIDVDETYVRLSEVCRFLLEQNILPVIIGGSHDLDYGQYTAYEGFEKLVSFLNVDALLDLEDKHGVAADRRHLHKILLHEPNYLMGYTHLAYQSFLIDPSSIGVLEKLYFEAFRIGQMRTSLAEIEPAVRQADLLSFDLTAIRSSDSPGCTRAQPFGLTGEEACQLLWYAGLNDKLSSVGIYGYSAEMDDLHRKSASVVATMIWYFIEGYYRRKKEQDFRSNDFIKYTVSLPVEPETITFYKSKFTDRWWMEVPKLVTSVYSRNSVVPCNYSDYQTAAKGEVPDRYVNAVGRG